MYPELACKEALINSITHRDYSNEGRGIEVKIYDDRLTIENPGELLSSITLKDIESLTGAHQSRNTYIARVLKETGYIRELGEGIRRIYDLMNNNDMIPPQITSKNKTYSITLSYKQVYSKEEQLWLENFKSLELSREQKTVVRLGVNGRKISAKEIFENVGIVDEKAYRELVESLKAIGILENTLSPNQISYSRKKFGGSRKAVPRYTIHIPNEVIIARNTEEEDRSEYARIYVGNIPYDVDEEEIIGALSKFGEVVDVVLPRWSATKKSKGFCFVEFDKKLYANNALNTTSDIFVQDRKLYLREADKMK
jgi:ATP-dependent DNA helicase RecG